jgi:glycosyltransferase involved in cell wall biosynthesis
MARRPADVIISVAPPFTSVLVGLSANRRHPQTPWVLDLGDPFSFLEASPPNNFAVYRALNLRCERAALTRAAEVAVTNNAVREAYRRHFPESSAKLAVIPPLVSLPEIDGLGAPILKPSASVKLVYAGALLKTLRRPDWLLALIAKAGERRALEMHFFGDTDVCRDSFTPYASLLGTKFQLHGIRAREHVARAMKEADVLVNIGNATADQLPSKVVEYAATGKPILTVASRDDDVSAEFLASYPRHLVLRDKGTRPTESDVDRLLAFLGTPAAEGDGAKITTWLEEYRLPKVSERYLQLLEKARRESK